MTGQMPKTLYKHLPIHHKTFFSNYKLQFIPADKFENLSTRIMRDNIREYFIKKRNISFIDGLSNNKIESKNFIDTLKYTATQIAKDFAKETAAKFLRKANLLQEDTDEIKEYLNQAKIFLHEIHILQMREDILDKGAWEYDPQAPFNPPHTGFMLGLDTRNSFFHSAETEDTPRLIIFPAIPTPDMELPYFSDCFATDDETYQLLLFLISKSKQFENIHEWRAIRMPTATKSALPADIDVPPQMVREVYLGARADEFLEAEAAEFCKKNNAKLFRMVLDGDDLIEPTPIHLS